MAGRIAPKVSTDGLLMYLDVANPKSFRGEPTTNLAANGGLIGLSNITLVYLGLDGDWKKYGINGTFTGDTYPYIMQTTAISFTSGITYTSKCTIRTNVLNKFNTFGISGINYVNQPLINVGVNSSVINSDGSRTVSRTAFAYSGTTTQPGYLLTNPINNTTFNPSTDFVWIKDLQIEQKSYATPYVNGTRGATVATGGGWGDISGKGKDGELTNGPTFNSSNLGSIVFDGLDDYVRFTNSEGGFLDGSDWFPMSTNAFTFDTWIKSPGISSGGTVNGIISLTYGVVMRVTTIGRVQLLVWDNVLSATTYTSSVKTNTYDGSWHHIVGTNDGLTSKIYIDGVLDTSTSAPFYGDVKTTWYVSSCVLGFDANDPPRGRFKGNMGVFRMYNRALSAQEVLQNYNTLKSRYI